LFAPNDPKFVEEDERRQREKRKIQLAYQKRNAELALLDYTVQSSSRGPQNLNRCDDETSPIVIGDFIIVFNEEEDKQVPDSSMAVIDYDASTLSTAFHG
jgi:hypothetical protein